VEVEEVSGSASIILREDEKKEKESGDDEGWSSVDVRALSFSRLSCHIHIRLTHPHPH
jgi:hypothetical protein